MAHFVINDTRKNIIDKYVIGPSRGYDSLKVLIDLSPMYVPEIYRELNCQVVLTVASSSSSARYSIKNVKKILFIEIRNGGLQMTRRTCFVLFLYYYDYEFVILYVLSHFLGYFSVCLLLVTSLLHLFNYLL